MPAFDLAAAFAAQLGLSLVLAVPILALRRIAFHRLASREPIGAQAQTGRIRLIANLCLALVLGFVWIAELQSLLLSITAVLMAVVIATKELIQCGTGALLRGRCSSLRVGDQVSVEGTSGRVVAHSILTTTIEETDSRSLGSRLTGRRLIVPNSRLFSASIHVEARDVPARHHVVSVILDEAVPLRDLLWEVEASALRQTTVGAPQPCVALATTELGKIRLDIGVFCEPGRIAAAEREITLDVLEAVAAHRSGVHTRRPILALVERDAA